jgi:chromosome transmission fidelity protein 1
MVRFLLLIFSESNEPEWVVEHAKARKRRELLRQREDMEARFAKIRAKEKAQKERYLKGDQSSKRRKLETNATGADDEEQFVLDDYESDGDSHVQKSAGLSGVYSAATLELMEQLGMGKSTKEEEVELDDETKVSYFPRFPASY